MTLSRENEWREISTERAKRAMVLPPLGLDVEYAKSSETGTNKALAYEKLVLDWLKATKPGSFHHRAGGKIYHEAHRRFTMEGARKGYEGNTLDSFEICLSRLGFRAGVLVHQGRELWLLILPSPKAEGAEKARQEQSLDQAFKDLLAGEKTLSERDVDSLLEVLADREVSTRDPGGTVATEQPRS